MAVAGALSVPRPLPWALTWPGLSTEGHGPPRAGRGWAALCGGLGGLAAERGEEPREMEVRPLFVVPTERNAQR